ncbi:LysR family transcriptional regulator [Desulfosporosinus shakirovi]|uniref:LysR family transcriptional regulator n=1 Tax=Desulfosporosinus shakirovi TaxID=2885154 RepID=UPI001E5FF35C|nr:LysR family transcriptional regulator [Desulfosporosinus sp. SRJS8]MCB8814640.1 LysR family transcriptional regulator [Desulfosporosinus sp. SRJS8]
MRLEQLKQIIKIQEQQSISKAASDLFISQPSLSVSVNNLEEELGLKLFERSNTGVIVTEQGKEILRLAENILILSDRMIGIMEGTKVSIRNLQMALPASFAKAIVPGLLRQFRDLYPEVNLHIHEASFYEIVDLMDKGIYSIGIISYRADLEYNFIRQLKEKDIAWELIPGGERLRLSLFISSKNPLAAKEWVSKSELRNMRMISYKEVYSKYSKDLERSFHKPVIVEDIELLKKLISNDFGYAIFPEILAYEDIYVESGMIKVIPIKELSEPSNVYILYSSKESLSFIERELLTIVNELITDKL